MYRRSIHASQKKEAFLLGYTLTDETEDTEVTLNGERVPVWFLDADAQEETITALPMSEGLAAYDGDLLILFESGASFYKDNGGKNPTDRIWKMKMD